MLLFNKKNILLLALSGGLLLPLQTLAANPQEAQQRAQEAQQKAQQGQQRAQQEGQQRMQEAQQRAQQEGQQRQQEAQQRQQQMQQAQQQRQQQEQQGQQQRQQQEQAQRQQLEQSRQQQEQQRQQAMQQRQQQEQQLRQQEQQSKSQQQQAIHQQQETARQQKDQARQQDIQVRQQQDQRWQQPDRNREQGDQARQQADPARQQAQQNDADRLQRPGGHSFANDLGGNPISHRAERPTPITDNRLPLNKAIAMPELAHNASNEDRDHLREVQRNLQAHLIAVSAADRPQDWERRRDFAREQYFNNYQATIANQQYQINRQNTFINALEQNQWPYWYQPQPGWQFANGYTFGNSYQDLSWLRWGWHPYYGPQPDGFICAQDYFPTPWVFIPAYGTWRQPGLNAYAQSGPPYDYTGPISVEVFEPRQINVSHPFFGGMPPQVMNAVYMFNAYYNPQMGRYGYTNQYGNFIWLDLNPLPF